MEEFWNGARLAISIVQEMIFAFLATFIDVSCDRLTNALVPKRKTTFEDDMERLLGGAFAELRYGPSMFLARQ